MARLSGHSHFGGFSDVVSLSRCLSASQETSYEWGPRLGLILHAGQSVPTCGEVPAPVLGELDYISFVKNTSRVLIRTPAVDDLALNSSEG